LEEELRELCKKLGGYEKKPLVHVRVEGKNIDRQSAYQILTSELSGVALSFRQDFADESQQRLPVLKPGSFQVNQVIQEYFKEPKVAGLAVELWRHLRSGDVDEAKKVAEDYYQKENPA
jgi:hypothetical protein